MSSEKCGRQQSVPAGHGPWVAHGVRIEHVLGHQANGSRRSRMRFCFGRGILPRGGRPDCHRFGNRGDAWRASAPSARLEFTQSCAWSCSPTGCRSAMNARQARTSTQVRSGSPGAFQLRADRRPGIRGSPVRSANRVPIPKSRLTAILQGVGVGCRREEARVGPGRLGSHRPCLRRGGGLRRRPGVRGRRSRSGAPGRRRRS